jgi:IS4 transposase
LTKGFDPSAQEAAELYRRRAEAELFFKWIKHNLKIKAFYGTSKNAALIQIWTALSAYLLLVWLKFNSKTDWGLLQLFRLVISAGGGLDLWAVLGPPLTGNRQILLFN